MKSKEFDKFLIRDLHRCYHCGLSGDQLVPQHRIGRGMGGKHSKADLPSNIITFCSQANGLLESDADFAELARGYGWKLATYESPTLVPVFEAWSNSWWLLGDSWFRALNPPEAK